MANRWLIVAAHADDEAKSAGLIFKERKKDEPLTIIWMTTGQNEEMAKTQNISIEKLIELRRNEALESAKLLNAEPVFCCYPTRCVPNHLDKLAVDRMVKLIEERKPSIIITHFYVDNHPDHNNTCALVEEAIKRLSYKVKYLYYEDQPSPTKKHSSHYKPNYFVDISDIVEKCLKIRTLHKTQIPEEASAL